MAARTASSRRQSSQPARWSLTTVTSARLGPAVFYRLRELRPGDTIRVRRPVGDWLAFEVSGTARPVDTS